VLVELGGERLEEVAAGESVLVGGVELVATPAVHDERRRPIGGARAHAIGFLLRGAQSIYFAGDTDRFDGMARLEPDLGLALLPVWGWGPSLGEGHLDPAGAARAAAMLRPRVAVPIHWGTFYPRLLRAGDRLTRPPLDFAGELAKLAPGIGVRVLAPGESLTLAP
jgi:L-ascorbate metabolism protein UlaG (beta-lactamase superfamily)